MNNWYRSFALVCAVAVSASTFAAEWYTYTDLGTFNAVVPQPLALNNAGEVVSTASNRALVYRSGAWQDLLAGDVPAPTQTIADHINNSGVVTGSYPDAQGYFDVFYFDATGLHTVTHLSRPTQISDTGQIIAAESGFAHDSLYDTASQSFITVDPFGTANDFLAINDAGVIVGHFSVGVPSKVCAFLRTPSPAVVKDLSLLLPANNESRARDINDQNVAVGFYRDATSGMHAFIYDDNNGSISTWDFPGATATEARAINNQGEILGSYTDAQGFARHFVCSGGVAIDLATVVDLPAGFNLSAVYDINDVGQISALISRRRPLVQMAVILTPAPAPCAGDANSDGQVGDADFGILLGNWGTGTTFAQGDFNGDNLVDDADFGILLTHWGVCE